MFEVDTEGLSSVSIVLRLILQQYYGGNIFYPIFQKKVFLFNTDNKNP